MKVLSFLLLLALAFWQTHGNSITSKSFSSTKDSIISYQSRDKTYFGKSLELSYLSQKDVLLGFDLSNLDPFCIQRVKLVLYTSSIFLPDVYLETIDFLKWNENNVTWNKAKFASTESPKIELSFSSMDSSSVYLEIPSNIFHSFFSSKSTSFRMSASTFSLFSSYFDSRESLRAPYLLITQNSTICAPLNETEKCVAQCKRSTLCQEKIKCQSLIDSCIYENPIAVAKSCAKNEETKRVAIHKFYLGGDIPIYTWKFYGVSNDTSTDFNEKKIIVGETKIDKGKVEPSSKLALQLQTNNLLYNLTSPDNGPTGTIWFIEEDTNLKIGIYSSFEPNNKRCKIKLPQGYGYEPYSSSNDCKITQIQDKDVVIYDYEFTIRSNKILSPYLDGGNVTISSREDAMKYHYYEKIVGDVFIQGNWESSLALDHLKFIIGSLTITHPKLQTLQKLESVSENLNIVGTFGEMLLSLYSIGGSVDADALSSSVVCLFNSIGGYFYIKNAKSVTCNTSIIQKDLRIESESSIRFRSLIQVNNIYLSTKSEDSLLDFISLKKINGDLIINSLSTIDFLSLETVNENVEVTSSRYNFPNLNFVGGNSFKISGSEMTSLNLNEVFFPRCTTLEIKDMPQLESINSLFNGVVENLTLKNLPSLNLISTTSFVNLTVTGNALIQGTFLKNLEGFLFAQLLSFNIIDNKNLESLKGLSSLKSVINDFKIKNHNLKDENSIKDLNDLQRASSFYIKLLNGREYLSIVQPCQCSMSGLFCNKPVNQNSFNTQVTLLGLIVKTQSSFSLGEPQKSIYLSRSLICAKNLLPKNDTELDSVYSLLKNIAEEATKSNLGQIAYKATTYYNTIFQGLQFSTYVPPYTSEFLLERVEKHLEFISISVLYYEELGTRQMTIQDLNELITNDFSNNNILVNNLKSQKKQIEDQIQKEVKSLSKASNQLYNLNSTLYASLNELIDEVEDDEKNFVLDLLFKCFSFALDITIFCVTFNPEELGDAVETFGELADGAIEFYEGLPNGSQDYPQFDEIFIDLNDIWPQLQNVIGLISRLQKLLEANGSIESISGLLEQSDYSLSADWKSLPSKMRSSISNICTPNSENDIAIPCQVFIDTLVTLSFYGEEITELSKSLTDLSRQSTLVSSSLADYYEAEIQLKEIQKRFESSITASEEARLVADRHLANLVQITVGEIQEFCLSVRYVYPGSTFDGCNVEDVYYSGGQTLIELQSLFLRIYESHKNALGEYLTDQQEIGTTLINITDRVPIEVLLSGKYAWFNIDRSLGSLSKENFPYLEIVEIVFFISGFPFGTTFKLDYTFNSPFIKDDQNNEYSYSMKPFEDNILEYEYIPKFYRCPTFCPIYILDDMSSICVCTNAQFKSEILSSPTFFSRAALRILNVQTILETIRNNNIDPRDLEVYFTAKLRSFVDTQISK